MSGYSIRFPSPHFEESAVFEHIDRHFVVMQRFELGHVHGFVVSPIGFVNLKVQHMLRGDQGKEDAVEIQAITPEHLADRDLTDVVELLQNVVQIVVRIP
jgi:hypothetical protein